MDAGHTWSLSDGSAQRPTRGPLNKKTIFHPSQTISKHPKGRSCLFRQPVRNLNKIKQADISHLFCTSVHRLNIVSKTPGETILSSQPQIRFVQSAKHKLQILLSSFLTAAEHNCTFFGRIEYLRILPWSDASIKFPLWRSICDKTDSCHSGVSNKVFISHKHFLHSIYVSLLPLIKRLIGDMFVSRKQKSAIMSQKSNIRIISICHVF